MSTYSPDLRIELITTGDQAGTWGSTTNTNLAYVVEQAIAGYISVAVASANQALTYINGGSSTAALNQSVHAAIALTTSTGANFAVYAPPASKQYTIYNASSYVATIYNSTVIGNTTAAPGATGVSIPAGKTMTVWSDGTNMAVQNSHLIGTVVGNVTGNVTGNLDGNLTASAPTAATAAPGTSTTQIATTAFSAAAITAERTAVATLTNKSLTSPTLTGTPVAPTAAVNTNDTQVATTAFVVAQIADDAPTKTGTGASGTWGIDISGNAATATTASNGFGVGQSWSSPSRSAGVWYQNTTGKPIMVNLVLGSYQISSLLVGVSTTVYETANYTDNDIYQVNAMSGVVPNNYYYQSTGAVSYWYELR